MREVHEQPASSEVRRQTIIRTLPCLACYGAAGAAAVAMPGNVLLLPLAGFFAACAGCVMQDGSARLKASLAAEAQERRISHINSTGPE